MIINNSISEDFCSFEVSKLLKEKGFKVKPEGISPTDYILGYDNYEGLTLREFQWEDCTCELLYLRPTHAIAIKWIRENFGAEIHTNSIIRGHSYGFEIKCSINYGIHVFTQYSIHKCCFTPQEATEAALKYFLTELIKEL